MDSELCNANRPIVVASIGVDESRSGAHLVRIVADSLPADDVDRGVNLWVRELERLVVSDVAPIAADLLADLTPCNLGLRECRHRPGALRSNLGNRWQPFVRADVAIDGGGSLDEVQIPQ